MGYTRRHVVGDVRLSTPGASLQVESVVVRGKDYDRLFAGTQVWNIPFPLFQSILVEGVDLPFDYKRTGQTHELPDQRKRYRRARDYWKWGEGHFAYALFNEPPNTDLLFFSRIDFTHPSQRAKLRFRTARLPADFTEVREFPTTLMPASDYGVTVAELLEEIQYHLMVTPDGGETWDVWSKVEVLRYLQDRLAKFMIDTGIIQDISTFSVSANPVALPSSVLRVRLARWNGKRLTPIDTPTADALYPSWSSVSGTPESFVYEPNRPDEIRLVPTPDTPGTLRLFHVPKPATLDTSSILPIPNVFTYGLKYGTMADMLSKQGEANDAQRAQFCELRFKESVVLARAMLGLP